MSDINISNQALTAFVVTQVINIGGLCADYLIIKAGLPAITDLSVKYPIIGTTILIFECISPISLGIHFWYYPVPNNTAV
jgi:hypothetical protein